jgi:quercetin dioxygenase-like cupin family protein
MFTQAPEVKVVQPGEGRTGGLGPGVGVAFKIDGSDSGGALSIVEHPFEVGALVPPHMHLREDEFSIVLEGQIGFRSEDQEVVLGPGGYIVKPRGEVHAMWNAGTTPARMIEVISPAGFEDFFRGLCDMTDAGGVDMERAAALSAEYQLPFAEPDWLPDVISRYNLTPPPSP